MDTRSDKSGLAIEAPEKFSRWNLSRIVKHDSSVFLSGFFRTTKGRFIFILCVLVFCTLLGRITASHLVIENVAMIYLLGVVLVASQCGGRSGLITCVLSILAFDLFITAPQFKLGPLDDRLLVTYGVMFVVAGVMNHLTGKIYRLMSSLEDRVRKRTQALEQEVLKRQEKEQSLKTAVETLIKSNLTLTNFGRLASHDLQEPLRTIEGFAELLQKRYGSCLDDKGRRFLGIIIDTASYAGNNVDNLLTHAQMSAEENEFSWVDCNSIVDHVLVSLSATIAQSGAIIRREELPVVWGDESLLSQVFQNLIVNAIKYSGASTPEIDIRAFIKGRFYLISVIDRGLGFESSDKDKIFEPFVRLVDDSRCGGTGLGLSICKSIAELHGGNISAHSTVGAGTTVTLQIPNKNVEKGDSNEQTDRSIAC
ncbi:MAG: DUF4118 domain-containing protein [Candidatus Obscuribacterales bacterium]|nr:DUF4118 domain-containing protein [Candidatus Obscuribacterales bacterium]